MKLIGTHLTNMNLYADRHNNIDEFKTCWVKEALPKRVHMYDSIYMKCQNKTKLIDSGK